KKSRAEAHGLEKPQVPMDLIDVEDGQGPSLKLELTNLSRMTGHQDPETFCLSLPSSGIIRADAVQHFSCQCSSQMLPLCLIQTPARRSAGITYLQESLQPR
ncbi:mCG57799, partial [Mus musculus]